jgi:hypothetical protein
MGGHSLGREFCAIFEVYIGAISNKSPSAVEEVRYYCSDRIKKLKVCFRLLTFLFLGYIVNHGY